MKDFDLKIEEASIQCRDEMNFVAMVTSNETEEDIFDTGFILGAKSEIAKEYWLEYFKKEYLKNINRVEIINHNSITKQHELGRIFTHNEVKSCELSFQDENKTLKIFI